MNAEEILKQLVQIKSFSGQEQKLANFIMDFAKKNDLDVEKQDGNIVIKFINGFKKALIYNIHMDTVKPGDIKLWHYPPFGKEAGVIKNGKLYGLGASDAKASIAAFLLLALGLQKKNLPVDVFIVFVCNEEIDGSGSKKFIDYFKRKYINNYPKIAAILGEPTNLKSIEIGNKGNIFIKITTLGNSGHASQPSQIKKHAINEMIKTISQIKHFEEILKKKYYDETFGYPTFCLTGIQSFESSPNQVPASCSSVWDIRTTPKLHENLLEIFKKELETAIKIELFEKPTSPGFTSPEEKIVKIFKNLVTGLKIEVSPASNDICFFTNAGIPAVTFGPGSKETEHKENEWSEIKNIEKSVAIYQKIIDQF